MNNFTPVSMKALFIVLENIESNVKLNEKPPSKDKAKGLKTSARWIPSRNISPRRPRRAGQRSTVLSARNMGVCTRHTTPRSAGATKVMGPVRRWSTTPSLTGNHVTKMG